MHKLIKTHVFTGTVPHAGHSWPDESDPNLTRYRSGDVKIEALLVDIDTTELGELVGVVLCDVYWEEELRNNDTLVDDQPEYETTYTVRVQSWEDVADAIEDASSIRDVECCDVLRTYG